MVKNNVSSWNQQNKLNGRLKFVYINLSNANKKNNFNSTYRVIMTQECDPGKKEFNERNESSIQQRFTKVCSKDKPCQEKDYHYTTASDGPALLTLCFWCSDRFYQVYMKILLLSHDCFVQKL